jgi:hypothetical protein
MPNQIQIQQIDDAIRLLRMQQQALLTSIYIDANRSCSDHGNNLDFTNQMKSNRPQAQCLPSLASCLVTPALPVMISALPALRTSPYMLERPERILLPSPAFLTSAVSHVDSQPHVIEPHFEDFVGHTQHQESNHSNSVAATSQGKRRTVSSNLAGISKKSKRPRRSGTASI